MQNGDIPAIRKVCQNLIRVTNLGSTNQGVKITNRPMVMAILQNVPEKNPNINSFLIN